MSKYDLNIKKLALSLLPFSLRSETVKALIQAFIFPFFGIKCRFDTYRRETDKALSFTCQVFSIEAALNYYLSDYLSTPATVNDDNENIEAVLVYPELEEKPVITDFVVYPEALWGYYPFTVTLPADLQGNIEIINRVKAIVNKYKMLGTKYIIEYE